MVAFRHQFAFGADADSGRIRLVCIDVHRRE
jgi:hypothetical protein